MDWRRSVRAARPHRARTIDQALEAALGSAPGAQPLAIVLPTRQQAARRIELCGASMDESATLVVDDAGGTVTARGGNSLGTGSRHGSGGIHDDSHAGWPWRVLVFSCGLFPPILGLSGVIIWLQRRSMGKSPKLWGYDGRARTGGIIAISCGLMWLERCSVVSETLKWIAPPAGIGA